MESVDDVRRKVFAKSNADKLRREIANSQVDSLVGRAYAELELEERFAFLIFLISLDCFFVIRPILLL